MKMKRKPHKYWRLLLFLLIMATLCSCIDNKIAKDIEGTWYYPYTDTYKDGTKSHFIEFLRFNKTPNKNSGTFVEIIVGEEPRYEKYQWIVRVEGTWEIKFKVLNLIYDISTLSVGVDEDARNILYKQPDGIFNGDLWSSAFGGAMDYRPEKIRKEVYTRLFLCYKDRNDESDEGAKFTSVEISKDKLNYVSSAEILVTYDKVLNK